MFSFDRLASVAIVDDYGVTLRGPETHRLADMAGVQQDLSTVVEAVDRLLSRPSRGFSESLELEALQAYALIRYGRCFGRGGVRTAFLIPRAWLDELGPDLSQAHADFLDLRDKHIAHSVNDWEVNIPRVRVSINRETGAAAVHAVTVDHANVLLLSSDAFQLLRRLASALADRIEQEMVAEKAALLEHAKRIPLEELKRRIHEDPAEQAGVRKIGNPRGRP